MANSGKYIKIELKDSVCLAEPDGSVYSVYGDELKGFFSLFPDRMVFIQNEQEQITGAISAPTFIRGLTEEGYCPIIQSFYHIACHENYSDEVTKFFQEKPWGWVPVLDKNGRLVEYFVREHSSKHLDYLEEKQVINAMDMLNQYGGAWINTAGDYLAKLVQSMQYKIIRVCMTDFLSEQIYLYFKHYETYFEKVEKTYWNDLSKTNKGEALILTSKHTFLLDIKADLLYYFALQAELEFNLLLHTCKQNNVRLYLVSLPDFDNVWNLTEEERSGSTASSYLKRYNGLLCEGMEGFAEFIDACQLQVPLIIRDGLCYHRDRRNKYFNVVNGERVTHGRPASVKNQIYLSGSSFVFGQFVDDAHTLASLLQSRINQLPEFQNYEVVNQGICGAVVKENLKKLNCEHLKSGDIVVQFFCFQREHTMGYPYLPRNMKLHHLEDAFNSIDRRKEGVYFIDTPMHPNITGYEVAADYVLNMLQGDYDESRMERLIFESMDVPRAEVYFNKHDDELESYLQGLRELRYDGKIGAVVVNCNPLTHGHKHLIEYAASNVDHLFVFVAQEDRSAFPFKERFEMVCACVGDRPDITVLPSGKYIVSMASFPDYFTAKAKLASAGQDFKPFIDSSLDLTLFGKFIAPTLNISVRFIGEEPLDYVTAQYNQRMKQILPEYAVEVVEIPRYQKDGRVVSASSVRAALAGNQWDQIKALVPETTYQLLQRKYMPQL